MKTPAVFYSDDLDCIVVVRSKAIDSETGNECAPIEWDWHDLIHAQLEYRTEDPFEYGEFIHIGDF